MRTHWLSAVLPPFLLLLFPVGCDPDRQSEVTTSSAIRTGEAPASIEPRVDASDATVLTFEIETARSSASFTVEEEFLASARKRLGINAGITHTTGATRDVAGSLKLRVDGDSVTVLGGSFTANLSALRSDQKLRDRTLRDHFLESASFPLARFVITEVSDIPEAYAGGEIVRFQMTGEMTIREISHELIFEVSIALNGDTLSGTATTSLYMADYGIDPPSFAGLLEVKDGVTIEIVFVAHKK